MKYFKFKNEELNLDSLVEKVRGEENGAVVIFIGSVRNSSQGKKVVALSYEAEIIFGERIMSRIFKKVEEKWGETDIAVEHRIGENLPPGTVTLIIVVASPHREKAHEVNRFLLEKIKKELPVWKKEVFENGESHWVGWDN